MNYTKDELEVLLKAFKILAKDQTINVRQSLTSIEEMIKELYIKKVMEEFK